MQPASKLTNSVEEIDRQPQLQKLPGWKSLTACRNSSLRLLYFVHTAPKNMGLRKWLRHTIGNPEIASTTGSAIVFIVGELADHNDTEALRDEADREGDMVVLDFRDTYKNLSLKFLLGAKWVLNNCRLDPASVIVKMDDDVLVNVFALSSYVRSAAVNMKAIHCRVFPNGHPYRKKKSKWYVSKEAYSSDKYPVYCAGAAYLMRPAVLSSLYDASTHVPSFWVDDVYVTGFLAEYANSTLDLVAYLCADCNFKCVLTSKLSQDKLENLFGIVRQFNGTNDHPTPAQFLATLNVLAFYNLARPPKGGNCDPQTITALLGEANATCRKSCPDVVSKLDKLVDVGNLEDAEHAMNSFAPHDNEYITQNSPARLV
ncbi:hypothetical protein HPB48_009627 [Haemaphysalis longicornis]|uniref:Hexosyltransferase n=1 Tax=Haemaphysalis longicornis TaxID=44386 RepID=A0A9J6FT36_HAELO|nr:hypothetical protein HPB48_009627 [Haemaphysalis longicornis]